ncbi:hypothetical protein Patl1_34138 [Pistacia atlantica]|uniref:Uncharacterized protein n=1 Tax=Pistacia atlantica TaxID=434234 RepID=A0ACC0ZTM2_9ROSI|nr:hypothetical protein Patl1_34138 [Pistacia atlantica]
MSHVSDIRLIRTDTTLDLSQKAEKGMLCFVAQLFFYSSTLHCVFSCFINVGETRPDIAAFIYANLYGIFLICYSTYLAIIKKLFFINYILKN